MDNISDNLDDLVDHRTRKGRRYSLRSVVLLSLFAMLCGADSLLAIHRFAKCLSPQARLKLGIAPKRIPAHSNLHYIFKEMDSECLAKALRG